MISIKRLLEQRRHQNGAEHDLLEAAMQMSRLLLDAISTHAIRGRDADATAFARVMKRCARSLNEPPSALRLLEISSEVVEAMETHSASTAEFFHQQNAQMHSMVAMLTQTLADVAGQSDESVARLHAIEHQIEKASELDDMRALTTSLGTCLTAVREAAAQQKKGSAATVSRLRDQIDVAQNRLDEDNVESAAAKRLDLDLVPEADLSEEVAESPTVAYVAAFKLQRADHIAMRFGAGAKNQMLSLISQTLKSILGPQDRLLRWKGTSFVMFLNSSATLNEIRVLLTEAVARTGQHYIEVGKKAALISVGVDWIVFPQAQCPSLDAVFSEVDAFLARETPANSSRIEK